MNPNKLTFSPFPIQSGTRFDNYISCNPFSLLHRGLWLRRLKGTKKRAQGPLQPPWSGPFFLTESKASDRLAMTEFRRSSSLIGKAVQNRRSPATVSSRARANATFPNHRDGKARRDAASQETCRDRNHIPSREGEWIFDSRRRRDFFFASAKRSAFRLS